VIASSLEGFIKLSILLFALSQLVLDPCLFIVEDVLFFAVVVHFGHRDLLFPRVINGHLSN